MLSVKLAMSAAPGALAPDGPPSVADQLVWDPNTPRLRLIQYRLAACSGDDAASNPQATRKKIEAEPRSGVGAVELVPTCADMRKILMCPPGKFPQLRSIVTRDREIGKENQKNSDPALLVFTRRRCRRRLRAARSFGAGRGDG